MTNNEINQKIHEEIMDEKWSDNGFFQPNYCSSILDAFLVIDKLMEKYSSWSLETTYLEDEETPAFFFEMTDCNSMLPRIWGIDINKEKAICLAALKTLE